MLIAPRGLGSLLTGLSVALLIGAIGGFGHPPTADHSVVTAALGNEPVIDTMETGSVGRPAVTASFDLSYVPVRVTMSTLPLALPPAPPVGSDSFRAALAVLVDGEPAKAFELGATLTDPAERRTMEWAAIYYGSGKVDYQSVIRFAAEAPAFADTSVFKTRLEQALVRADAAGPEVIRVLGGDMPNTVSAQIALALAYVADGQRARAAGIASQIWTNEFLDKDDENRFFKKLGQLLTPEDHWARAVHLMMHDRATAAARLLPYLSDAQKSLVVARNAVSRNAKDAKKLLDAVDPSMQTHPVYLFSRAQRARGAEMWDDAVALLDKATGTLPDAEEWWFERRALVRQLLTLGKYELAYTAAAGFTDGPPARLAEAKFHAGWIALAFRNDAKAALTQFDTMQTAATTPDLASQAFYWTGRAKLALGDKLGANEAFMAGARYRTVYYGLLSRAELGMRGAQLKDMPDETDAIDAFDVSEVVRAVRLLAGNGQKKWALPLLRSYANGLDDAPQLLLAAELADEIDAPSLAITIAENADKRGIPLDMLAFPRDRLPVTHVAENDHAALYAITRQESHFQVDAVSSAGARGFMQLMPGTAKETAQKVGVEYSKSRLTSDGAYNALLGSTYLSAQLARYDGSLALAAAAYNAGPGNANKWIDAFGDPRDPKVDPVTWVEQIPVQETRTYVKRVVGNYIVYRTQLGGSDLTVLEALRSIR